MDDALGGLDDFGANAIAGDDRDEFVAFGGCIDRAHRCSAHRHSAMRSEGTDLLLCVAGVY